ncbi:DUF4145 domain-containing protein [Agrobacterium sp. BA1120]|uniref:DUF4145 domain-containing protein n=1 Tax=Agrobacterium sp. BA1120 TaxID=3228927 RepID=UPI00336AAD74
MAESENFFNAPCVECKRATRHKVVAESVEPPHEDYQCRQTNSVIECQGCGTKSFRYLFVDYENAYPISDDDWEVPEDAQFYPKYNPDHIELDNIFHVPDVVREIYAESMLAVQAGALTLAGLGLRGTIEAVCNERGITGRNLEARITKMATQGLISTKDSERLHAIRFLGNDAAHEIKKPSESQISVALKIINHLIQSIYLLEIEMHRKLDTIISKPDEFENLLNQHLVNFEVGDEYPIAKFLGKDIRRLGQGVSTLESHLLAAIGSGNFTKLAVGKVAKFASSKNDLQHFVKK